MKNSIFIALIVLGITCISATGYAGDKEWATAGKILAVVEGARVITGGNVDIVGNITGIRGNGGLFSRGNSNNTYGYNHQHARNYSYSNTRTWVPHYTWRKKYIPEHEEYNQQYGRVIVEGHYIQYQIEDGGHWE